LESGLTAAWPAAFWLALPVLLALLLFRLYRTRRKEHVTGSLLLWRRLALLQSKTPPKRVPLDLSLLLQALALLALVAALSGPVLALGGGRGRGLLLVLDNAPPARARGSDGAPLWKLIQQKAREILSALKPEDTVFLARTAPQPKLLARVSPPEAAALVDAQLPALSGDTAERDWLFAADTARSLSQDARLAAVVLSLRAPPERGSSLVRWLPVPTVPPASRRPPNVGIVDFGALPIAREGQAWFQVLVRVKNFSAQPVEGSLKLDFKSGAEAAASAEEKPCSLGAQAEQAVVFDIPKARAGAFRIRWSRAGGQADALPEDDLLVAVPRPGKPAPRVRFHAPAPALEKLYRVALGASLVSQEDAGELAQPAGELAQPAGELAQPAAGADLEVYCLSVPDQVPARARGIMLLAPEAGYRMVFDVSGKTLNWPQPQRDEDDPLTKGILDKTAGIFPVPRACEILPTGDFKTLLKDAATGRALAARFVDEKQRFGLLLAFVPGAGFPAEKPLDPELAALLVRAALEAAGAGDPFEVTRAMALERRSGEPLPLDWRPDYESGPGAVLDEAVSAIALAGNGNAAPEALPGLALQPLKRAQVWDLRPWLIAAGMLLAALELWLEQRGRRKH